MPDKDSVIQIANIVQLHGLYDDLYRVIFTLKETAPIHGTDVICFEDEKKMLE